MSSTYLLTKTLSLLCKRVVNKVFVQILRSQRVKFVTYQLVVKVYSYARSFSHILNNKNNRKFMPISFRKGCIVVNRYHKQLILFSHFTLSFALLFLISLFLTYRTFVLLCALFLLSINIALDGIILASYKRQRESVFQFIRSTLLFMLGILFLWHL